MQNPVTQAYQQFLKNLQQEFKNQWANGTYTSPETHGTLQLNAEAIGKVRLLTDLLEVDYETFTEGLIYV